MALVEYRSGASLNAAAWFQIARTTPLPKCVLRYSKNGQLPYWLKPVELEKSSGEPGRFTWP